MPVLPPCCGADLQGIQRAFAEVRGCNVCLGRQRVRIVSRQANGG